MWQNQYEDQVTNEGIAVKGVQHAKDIVEEERDDYKMM
jgi:hypothetical protein